jgi:hypothetical protein
MTAPTRARVGRERIARRRAAAAALAVAIALPIAVAEPVSAAPVAPGPVQLTLPAPTGPYPVGTVPLHLVDGSRPDPVAGPGHHRELMTSVVPRPERRAVPAGALDVTRLHAGAPHIPPVQSRRRARAPHGRPRGRPGAANG